MKSYLSNFLLSRFFFEAIALLRHSLKKKDEEDTYKISNKRIHSIVWLNQQFMVYK